LLILIHFVEILLQQGFQLGMMHGELQLEIQILECVVNFVEIFIVLVSSLGLLHFVVEIEFLLVFPTFVQPFANIFEEQTHILQDFLRLVIIVIVKIQHLA